MRRSRSRRSGMPILRTIAGTGTLEGGTVVKITPRVYAFGASIRCNPEGARQLAEVLAPLGIELIVVPLPGSSIHLDGHLSMVDRDKALCDVRRLPYWFAERLRAARDRAHRGACRTRTGRSTDSSSGPAGLLSGASRARPSASRGAASRSSRSRTARSSGAAAASTARPWNCGATAPREDASGARPVDPADEARQRRDGAVRAAVAGITTIRARVPCRTNASERPSGE